MGLLVAIPVTDEIARRVFRASHGLEDLRTRLALTTLIPFGAVVLARELFSRRALARAGRELVSARAQLAQTGTTLARRALLMIERRSFDVVIADVKMPELSGQQLYARACMERPEMARRFIFITGDAYGEDTRAFLEQTRCGYFIKPFELERLAVAVEALVQGTREQQVIEP